MTIFRSLSLLFALLAMPLMLPAVQWVKSFSSACFMGPEVYEMRRVKEGGSKQNGILYGMRFGCDRVRRLSVYWGCECLWAQGSLTGRVGKDKLKSILTDMNVEVRLGYTLQSKCWRCLSFTPYAGIGYFLEKNDYRSPSPLPIHFKNDFYYVPVGFLSEVFITPRWSVGMNVKVRILLEGRQKVSHDPEHDAWTQHYEEKLQYRVEWPLSYFMNWKCYTMGFSLVPFIEYRHYGRRANFPFDFFDTQLNLYGATLKWLCLF